MMHLTSYPTFVEVQVDELAPMFANVKIAALYRSSVESISLVGDGPSECVRITFTRGETNEISHQMVESFDGAPVNSNIELYRKLNQINL